MSLADVLRRALALPPREVLRRGAAKVRREAGMLRQRRWDVLRPSYSPHAAAPAGVLLRYARPLPLDTLRPRAAELAEVCGHFVGHRFDLLGSGWVQVRHGMGVAGVEGHRYDPGPEVRADVEGRWLEGRINRSNLAESRRVWRLLADPGYRPIDWHLDFRSGFRWSEATWWREVPFAHGPGIDVKVPWELARMQHLPQLACAYALAAAGEPGFLPSERYAAEFRSQVLDFIATNPPRFGVNWRLAMDVAIRAASWLAAWDLFRIHGAEFDTAFERELLRSVYDHGRYVVRYLEWNREVRGNHYLANVAGLLFIAAYLPRSRETDAWLAFALRELVAETELQFTADGGSFESSTAYHRLSAEMVAYATALALGLPPGKQAALREYDARALRTPAGLPPAPVPLHPLPGGGESPFPPRHFDRLERMAELLVHATKPGVRTPPPPAPPPVLGEGSTTSLSLAPGIEGSRGQCAASLSEPERGRALVQVGDNDSGRFLKLLPPREWMTVARAKARYDNLREYGGLPEDASYWDEDALDARDTVAAINGLFGRPDLAAFSGEGRPEEEWVRSVTGGSRLPSSLPADGITPAERVRVGSEEAWATLSAAEEAPCEVQEIPAPGRDLREGARLFAYPDFGLYLYRSDRLFLAVRCGRRGQILTDGHAHDDELSIEVSVDGEDHIRDPGTYLYTALPHRRNEYRSARAHAVPRLLAERESGLPAQGLFELVGAPVGHALYWGPRGFAGVVEVDGAEAVRMVEVRAGAVVVTDRVRGAAPPDRGDPRASVPFSPGYGKREHR